MFRKFSQNLCENLHRVVMRDHKLMADKFLHIHYTHTTPCMYVTINRLFSPLRLIFPIMSLINLEFPFNELAQLSLLSFWFNPPCFKHWLTALSHCLSQHLLFLLFSGEDVSASIPAPSPLCVCLSHFVESQPVAHRTRQQDCFINVPTHVHTYSWRVGSGAVVSPGAHVWKKNKNGANLPSWMTLWLYARQYDKVPSMVSPVHKMWWSAASGALPLEKTWQTVLWNALLGRKM